MYLVKSYPTRNASDSFKTLIFMYAYTYFSFSLLDNYEFIYDSKTQ